MTAVTMTPSGVVTVGFTVGARGEIPIVARHTQAGWSVGRPLGTRGNGALLAVQQVGDQTWAAGWQGVGSGVGPLVVTGDGRRWQRVEPPDGSGAILDLAVDRGGDLWAVGYAVIDGRLQPAAWVRSQDAWTPLPVLPTTLPLAFLTGADGTDAGIVVAGSAFDPSAGRWIGIAGRWDGEAWRWGPGGSATSDLVLHDVAWAPGDPDPTFVGQVRKRSLVARWCETSSPVGAGPAAREPEPRSALRGSRRPVRPAPRAAVATAGRPVVARDRTRAAGLADTIETHGALVADVDRDGWVDVFILRHGAEARLLLNVDGRFAAPAGVSFPKADRHACTAADADLDGRLDIYCALGSDRGAGFKTNELWLQGADGTFSDVAAEWNLADPFGRGRVATFLDLDRDRWPDLFIGNQVPRTDGLPGPTLLLARPDGGTYRVRSTAGFDASMGAVCGHAADLDGDGWEDLVLCRQNLNRPDGLGIAWLRNEHGTLRDRTERLGLPRRATTDVLPVDLDRDGGLDLVEVTARRLYVHLRRGDGYVTTATAPLSAGRAVAAGDVDADGDPDLYVVQGFSESNPPDRVFLVRRGGRSLRAMAVPGTTDGFADTAVAIDHDRNGLSDFLVLNGSHVAGPIKLIAFYRRSAGVSGRVDHIRPEW